LRYSTPPPRRIIEELLEAVFYMWPVTRLYIAKTDGKEVRAWRQDDLISGKLPVVK
jgi:hypothetical protein